MTQSTWEELAAAYLAPFGRDDMSDRMLEALVGPLPRPLTEEELARFRRCDPDDQRGLARLLDDTRGRHVVKLIVFSARAVPEGLLLPMLRAAVRIRDPSYNKQFIWPCVVTHGSRRVLTVLLSLARHGSDAEKAGAVNARYWATRATTGYYWPEDLPRTGRAANDESIDDLNEEWAAWVVNEFQSSHNVEVQRALVSWLPERHDAAPAALEKAVAIAAAHRDPYIRQRMAVQRGESNLYPCYPESSSPSDDTS